MYVIRERFFGFGDDFDITDEDGRPVLRVDGKVLTMRDRLVLRDLNGTEVAQVKRRLVALRPSYEIEIDGQQAATVKKKVFTPFRDKFTIDIPGPDDLEMTGSLFEHEFTVKQGGELVATVSKSLFRIRDTYQVDVVEGADHLLVLAAVLAVDLAAAREEKDEEEKKDRD